ncbi:hypothetical protein NDA16_004858 [Ustilago loliicola]|nr:hypothetical protein NDA16_004858 [Ustilago loliicola]
MSAQPRTSSLLAGKKVVIIGGSSGLGFAAASALIEEGASVVIGSSSQARVDAAIKRLTDASTQFNADPSRVSGYPVNLKGSGVEKELEGFFGKIGAFDHLILTAGDSLASKPLSEFSYQDIVDASQVRYISSILAAKVATTNPQYLRQNAGGSIVFTTGVVAQKPIAGWSIPAGYAAATYGLTRNLALDLSDKRIRVNAVAPGPVETEMWDAFPEEQRRAFLDGIGKKLFTGKVATPDQLAQTYLYLLKDGNQTGQILVSDGGSSVTDKQ